MTDRLTVTVSGPQGCGKSTIISVIEDHLRERGASVLVEPEYRGKGGVDPDGFEVVIREVQADHPSLFEMVTNDEGRVTGLRANGVIVGAIQTDQIQTLMPGTKIALAYRPAAWINDMVDDIHLRNVDAGWWTDLATGESLRGNRNFGELLCLVHSEISEAMEGHRKNLMDDKLPHRKMAEVELADAVIRIFDLAGGFGFDLGGALVEKLAYNASRADHKPDNRKAPGGKAY